MSVIVARTYSGGRDLYHGIPDLTGAILTNVDYTKDNNDYNTTLTLVTKKGFTVTLIIVQEREDR